MDSVEAKEMFAKALSQAVFANEELRGFLKNEALKQFDRDYDVFYPFVKDIEVMTGKTFREILLGYITEEKLSSIERALPRLNILVPEWSWIGAFSVNTWDTSESDIIVGYDDCDAHTIYYNGEKEIIEEKGLFPTFPTLVIKENERMVVISGTKSGDVQYDFADDVYRNCGTKVKAETSYIYPATNPGSNYVDVESFKVRCPETVAAWEEYGAAPYSAQRSYIYYGLRQGETIGLQNVRGHFSAWRDAMV